MKPSMKGFTLIEVLLAIAIFAVISLASFSLLDGVMRAKQGVEEKQKGIAQLQRVWLLMERDFLQLARRSIRIDGERPQVKFLFTEASPFVGRETQIAFVRHGWTNPGMALPRSEMQSVAYVVEEETLKRLHFNFVDSIVDQEPKERELIAGVQELVVRYYYGEEWKEELPEGQWPRAIEVTIKTENYGELVRKFLLPEVIRE